MKERKFLAMKDWTLITNEFIQFFFLFLETALFLDVKIVYVV